MTCCIGDIPDSPRSTFLGINGVQAGRVGGEMLAQAIGGKGKVILGTFPAPSTLGAGRRLQTALCREVPGDRSR